MGRDESVPMGDQSLTHRRHLQRLHKHRDVYGRPRLSKQPGGILYIHTPDGQASHIPTRTADEGAKETVYHYLLECRGHARARARLERDVGPAAKSIRSLLSAPALTKALFRYIHETGRFTATYGDLSLKEEEGKGTKKTAGRVNTRPTRQGG